MNAFYVTVSIPLLLVLAGFNHAHGLTTFGKSNTQGQGSPPQTDVQGKHCTHQANCTLIKGTTCLKQFCLCGDNTHPSNGICNAQIKGPKHICMKDEECVVGAVCLDTKEKIKPNSMPSAAGFKTCQCVEGLVETITGTCSGGTILGVLPGLLLIAVAITKVY